jgi:hypothetical protein
MLILGVFFAIGGCAGKAAVEGSVPVTSTEPFKHLKGNTPQPPVMPKQ